MTSNSLGAMPFTPCPDPPSHSGDEIPAAPPAREDPGHQPATGDPYSSSSDDLNLLLTQSNPDPFLKPAGADRSVPPAPAGDSPATDEAAIATSSPPEGLESSSVNDLHLGIRFSPSPDVPVRVAAVQGLPASPAATTVVRDDDEPRVNWPMLLTASYASAVTLALAWLLWSGRGLARRADPAAEKSKPPAATSVPGTEYAKSSRLIEPPPPLPAPNVTDLGVPIRLGDIEVIPRSITRRQVELIRLDGVTGEQRESPDSLVLTLELTNRSAGLSLTPLDPVLVRESGSATDHSYIEAPGGRRIGIFRLAPESEWSLQDQVFPSLKPGASAETIVVSEPVTTDLPSGLLTWHVKLRTRTYQTDVVGVRFRDSDVQDWR
jgi:hypothetical protein